MIKNVYKIIKYDLYLVLLGALTFLSYMNIITDYLLPIFIVIALIAIFTKQKIMYIMPIPFFMQMSFSGLHENINLTILYVAILVVVIILDIIFNREIEVKGKLLIPLAVLSFLSILTGINGPDYFTTFAGWGQITIVLVLYFYFVNTLEDDEMNFTHVAKLFMYISLLVTAEMLYYIKYNDIPLLNVESLRAINLGWESLEIVIFANIIAIPLIGYLVLKSRVKLPYMIIAGVIVFGIIMTLSRSSFLTLVVYLLILLPLIFFFEKKKMSLIIQGLLLVMFGFVSLYLLDKESLLTEIYYYLSARDLTTFYARVDHLEVAWNQFKEFPVLGSGGFFSPRFYLEAAGDTAHNYYNIIAQASTLGILGLLGFVYLFFVKTRVILRSNTEFKWFVLVIVYVTAFITGMLQPVYFYTTYMMYIFLIIATLEVYKGNKQ